MSGNISEIEKLAEALTEEVSEEVKRFIAREGVNDEIEQDAAEMARIAARNILSPDQPPLKEFPRIPLNMEQDTEENIKYMLIQEFLQSAGFKFTSSVLKYESQHPDFHIDREDMGLRFGLPSYDKTPYLVQIIEEMLKKQMK